MFISRELWGALSFICAPGQYPGLFYLIRVSASMCFLLLFHSFAIHIRVESVYTGMKSPTIGMNSIMFTAVDILLLVILYNKLTIIASNISPITGTPNKGAAKII